MYYYIQKKHVFWRVAHIYELLEISAAKPNLETEMNLLKPLYRLIIHYTKGGRVEAALQKGNRLRLRTLNDFLKSNAEPVLEDGKIIGYDSKDVMMEFMIVTNGKLILKNNSKHHAYNIELINAADIFQECKNLLKLTSLAPNEKIEIDISFQQVGHFESGVIADKLPDVPDKVKNKILNIKYENEAGTKLLTKFWVSFTDIRNEQTYL